MPILGAAGWRDKYVLITAGRLEVHCTEKTWLTGCGSNRRKRCQVLALATTRYTCPPQDMHRVEKYAPKKVNPCPVPACQESSVKLSIYLCIYLSVYPTRQPGIHPPAPPSLPPSIRPSILELVGRKLNYPADTSGRPALTVVRRVCQHSAPAVAPSARTEKKKKPDS